MCALQLLSPMVNVFTKCVGVFRQKKDAEMNLLEADIVDGWVLLCFCPTVLVRSAASTSTLLELYLSTISTFLREYSCIFMKVRVLASHVLFSVFIVLR